MSIIIIKIVNGIIVIIIINGIIKIVNDICFRRVGKIGVRRVGSPGKTGDRSGWRG